MAEHTTIQGITPKINDVFIEKQMSEILGVFAEKGELCYSTLVKHGKDLNKSFVNNTAFMSIFKDLLHSGELVETKKGTCPYTGRPTEFYMLKEKSLEKVEGLDVSIKNILNYMEQHSIFNLSQSDLKKLL